MERHEEMLSPEEQYAQLAPTLDTDGFSLYAAAEEITGQACWSYKHSSPGQV